MSSELMLPVSIGEGLDKLTILDIKCSKISDDRLASCKKEYDVLLESLQKYIDLYPWHYKILREINLSIWNLQDGFHGKNVSEVEAGKICGQILEENDRRFRMKSKINHLCTSSLREVKGYAKKRCFFFGHLGLGDVFWLLGAVRYFATCYDEVILVTWKRYEANVRRIFDDDPTIILFCVETYTDIYPFNEVYKPQIESQGIKVLTCGQHGYNPIYDFPLSFYDDLGIPRSIRTSYFYIPNTIESEAIWQLVNSIAPKYIVVHQQSQNTTLPIWQHVAKSTALLILDLNKNHYSENHSFFKIAELVVGKPLFSYKKLLEEATEIHLLESSVYCMATHLDLSRVKVKLCYAAFDNSNERLGVFATGKL
jgi:hypothetical protein